MKDKTNGKLYKININSFKGTENSGELIDRMIGIFNKGEENTFEQKSIKKGVLSKTNFSIKLFTYVSDADKKPDWKFFIDSITEDDNSELMSISSSFLLFIYNKKEIYVLSRGYHGFSVINNFIENDFGLEVISCLVKQNSTVIRALNERRFFGDEYLTQRNFKGEFLLNYDDNFGKIYNDIIAEIPEEDFSKLGIVKKRANIKKVSVDVGASLEISSSFDFNELLNRIQKISNLLKDTKSTNRVSLNHFSKVKSSMLSKIEDKLEQKLFEKCFENISTSKNNIDFFYKDINTYITSKKISITDKFTGEEVFESEDLKSINYLNVIEELKSAGILIDTIENFKASFNELVFTLHPINESQENIDSTFMEWINTDIVYEKQIFFRIDGVWYIFENNIDSYLDNEIKKINFKNLSVTSLNKWSKTTKTFKTGKNVTGYHESHFNSNHRSNDCFIIADTCFHNYLELADLIRIDFDSKELYLYHVKRGIDKDLRVLSSQILNAVRTFRYDISDEMLGKYYDEIKKKQYDNKNIYYYDKGKRNNLNKTEFKKLFLNNNFKLNIVFAVSSPKKDDLKLQIQKSDSRIAKLSLLHTIKEIRKYDYDIKFELIQENK
jgi:uncharacterized protein (TIGR04141 family)